MKIIGLYNVVKFVTVAVTPFFHILILYMFILKPDKFVNFLFSHWLTYKLSFPSFFGRPVNSEHFKLFF